MFPRTRRRALKFDTRPTPVFPGYIFVNLDLERDRWHSVNGTLGVAYLVAFGDLPTAVPAGAVEALQRAFDKSNEKQVSPSTFAVGDQVELTRGPFASMAGKLLEINGSGRVRVLLELMGRETAISTVAADVLPVA